MCWESGGWLEIHPSGVTVAVLAGIWSCPTPCPSQPPKCWEGAPRTALAMLQTLSLPAEVTQPWGRLTPAGQSLLTQPGLSGEPELSTEQQPQSAPSQSLGWAQCLQLAAVPKSLELQSQHVWKSQSPWSCNPKVPGAANPKFPGAAIPTHLEIPNSLELQILSPWTFNPKLSGAAIPTPLEIPNIPGAPNPESLDLQSQTLWSCNPQSPGAAALNPPQCHPPKIRASRGHSRWPRSS